MAKIYWRRIKAGTRFYKDVSADDLKKAIKALAKADVEAGAITEEAYEQYIGEAYAAE